MQGINGQGRGELQGGPGATLGRRQMAEAHDENPVRIHRIRLDPEGVAAGGGRVVGVVVQNSRVVYPEVDVPVGLDPGDVLVLGIVDGLIPDKGLVVVVWIATSTLLERRRLSASLFSKTCGIFFKGTYRQKLEALVEVVLVDHFGKSEGLSARASGQSQEASEGGQDHGRHGFRPAREVAGRSTSAESGLADDRQEKMVPRGR